MQIGSRFTIGVHIITAIDYFKEMDRVNSEFLAGSIGVNSVIVRTVISQLREAGIVQTRRSVDETEGLFHFHEHPNPDCPVGRNIHRALDRHLAYAQKALEDELRHTTLKDIAEDTKTAVRNEP